MYIVYCINVTNSVLIHIIHVRIILYKLFIVYNITLLVHKKGMYLFTNGYLNDSPTVDTHIVVQVTTYLKREVELSSSIM